MREDTPQDSDSSENDGTDSEGLVPGFDADNIYHKIRKNEENELEYMDLLTCGI